MRGRNDSPQTWSTAKQKTEKDKKLRLELRQLKKRYKKSSMSENQGLRQLHGDHRTRLLTLRKDERVKKKRKEKTTKRSEFNAN